MSEPFLAEIKLVTFNFPPKGWAFCNGQLLPINQNQALFSLLGTTFGGDGRVNFALPNLQGRSPAHAGQGLSLGESAGENAHALAISELPAHVHPVVGSTSSPTSTTPVNNLWPANTRQPYSTNPNATMNAACLLPTGGSQLHENTPPYLVLNFVIALQGIFPSQT